MRKYKYAINEIIHNKTCNKRLWKFVLLNKYLSDFRLSDVNLGWLRKYKHAINEIIQNKTCNIRLWKFVLLNKYLSDVTGGSTKV